MTLIVAAIPTATHVLESDVDAAEFISSGDGEPRFFLGERVCYGLMNSANPPGPQYSPLEYEADHRDWASIRQFCARAAATSRASTLRTAIKDLDVAGCSAASNDFIVPDGA